MQETQVWSLNWEDPMGHGSKFMQHNYWPGALEPALHNVRSQRNEKPAHRNKRGVLTHRSQRKLALALALAHGAMKTQHSQK